MFAWTPETRTHWNLVGFGFLWRGLDLGWVLPCSLSMSSGFMVCPLLFNIYALLLNKTVLWEYANMEPSSD